MKRISCYTLFDITNTNVLNRSKPVGDNIDLWTQQRNSQANFDTILQCISLRGTPDLIVYPHRIEFDTFNDFGFLIDTDKDFWYWRFDFSIPQNSVFDNGIDPLGFLTLDCHEVPMLAVGTECLNSLPNFLDVTPELNNIYFEEHA